MRSELFEWYALSDAERAKVLSDGIFAFDANSLLTLYRLSKHDRDRVIELLDAVQERIWISNRAAEEFQRNRLSVFHEQLEAYDSLKKQVAALRNDILNSRAHPVLSQEDTRTEIADRLGALERYIDDRQSERHPDDLADPLVQDGVRDGLDRVFDGCVGRPVDLTAEVLAEAQRRVDEKIPPGYKDHRKSPPDRYGDYLVWSETLAYAENADGEPRPLLLVTEERKEDWWLLDPRSKGLVGPRPELVREAASKGVRPLWLLSLRRFFGHVAEYLGWDVPPLGEYAPVGNEDDRIEGGTDG